MEPRRTIDELSSRCRYESNVRDIFVEGHLDQAVIARFFRKAGFLRPQVVRVGQVEIPSEHLRLDERGSERGRLQALARQLELSVGDTAPVRCVVDRDYDDLIGAATTGESSLLIKTDLSSIEMYFFDSGVFEELCADHLEVSGLDLDQVMFEIEAILREASLMLAANQSLSLECGYIDIVRCCSFEVSGGVEFDAKEYMKRYLQKGSVWDRRDEFAEEVERLRELADADVRLWARGRCLLPLLGFALRNRRVQHDLCTPEIVERGLTRIMDRQYLMQFSVFQELDGWHGAAGS